MQSSSGNNNAPGLGGFGADFLVSGDGEEVSVEAQGSDLPAASIPGLGAAPPELEEVFGWLFGASVEPPESIQRMMGAMSKKLSWAMMTVLVRRLAGSGSIMQHLVKLEEKIIEVDPQMLSDREAMDMYLKLSKTQVEMMDFMRKFLFQAETTLGGEYGAYEELLDKMRALPKSKLEKLLSLFDEE